MSRKYPTFGDFWSYNKVKIFAVVFAIALIALMVSQCSWGDKLDLGIVHISRNSKVDGDKFLEDIGKDANLTKSGDELSLSFSHIYMPDDIAAASELGSVEKTQVELTTGDSTLYILDSETVYSYSGSSTFYDLTKIADKYNVSQEDRYKDDKGRVIAISVIGNSYLEAHSIPCSEQYIAVRNHIESKSGEYENAFKALEYIITNG